MVFLKGVFWALNVFFDAILGIKEE